MDTFNGAVSVRHLFRHDWFADVITGTDTVAADGGGGVGDLTGTFSAAKPLELIKLVRILFECTYEFQHFLF